MAHHSTQIILGTNDMKFLHKMALFLGRGKRTVKWGITWYLWPFVAMGIVLSLMLTYDYFLA